MSGYIGTKAVTLSTTTANVGGDSTVGGDLTVDTNTLYVDSTNNRVGIGTSTVNRKLEISGNNNGGAKANYIRITDTDTSATFGNQQGGIEFYTNDSGNENVTASIENLYAGSGAGSELTFNTAPNGSAGISERCRLTAAGDLLVGATSFAYNALGVGLRSSGYSYFTTSNTYPILVNRKSSVGALINFNYEDSAVGSVSTNGVSTSYNTSSDHRLKENVTDVTDGITRVKQLEPKRFNFIADPDKTVDGFLAHQAQAVVPEAVTGTHNEVDDDGNAVMQGIDQSKLVPLLTAALKESIAKIEALEARVTALEGN